MTSFADPMFLAADLMSFEDFTIWAMTESEHFRKTVNIFHERNMQNIKQMLDTQTVDLYRICGPEYCTPPFLPPHMFDEYVLPYVKDMCDLIHSYGKKVRFHSHGKISKVLDSILKTGADAIDPVEDLPDGDISLKDVKQKLKDKMCIFGNIQLKMLENSSEKEVRDYVNYCMDSAKEGYGYVIMPTASPINIPLSTKTQDNYFAFIDQALKAGIY